MILVREMAPTISFLKESKEGKPRLYIEGPFLQGEVVNANGRKYPDGVLSSACEKYIKEFVQTNRACGELNHPDHPQINFERACIRTVSLHKEGHDWIGRALVLSSPMGKLVESLHDDEVKLGVSSRGLASTNEVNGIEIIGEDYYICAAADVVSDPSAPDAFVNGVVERKLWMVENGIIREQQMKQIDRIGNSSVKKKITQEELNRMAYAITRLISESIV